MTDGGTVEVPLWKDSECPLPAFPHESKLFLALLWYVNEEESISKVYYIRRCSQLMAEGVQNVCYRGDGSMQRGCDFIQFPVACGHTPGAIWLFHWPHWGYSGNITVLPTLVYCTILMGGVHIQKFQI